MSTSVLNDFLEIYGKTLDNELISKLASAFERLADWLKPLAPKEYEVSITTKDKSGKPIHRGGARCFAFTYGMQLFNCSVQIDPLGNQVPVIRFWQWYALRENDHALGITYLLSRIPANMKFEKKKNGGLYVIITADTLETILQLMDVISLAWHEHTVQLTSSAQDVQDDIQYLSQKVKQETSVHDGKDAQTQATGNAQEGKNSKLKRRPRKPGATRETLRTLGIIGRLFR